MWSIEMSPTQTLPGREGLIKVSSSREDLEGAAL